MSEVPTTETMNETSEDITQMLNVLGQDGSFDQEEQRFSDEEDEETPQMLEALEQRQEQIIADFMERAFESKHEHVENLKASFR